MRERASRTALGVARALVFAAQHPEWARLLPDRAAEITRDLLGAASEATRRELRWMDRGWYRALVALNERYVVPGGLLHVALRKRFLDERVRAALDDGARRLVVLGAGLDTLALRVAEERPDVECVELDHPSTQELKRRCLLARAPLPTNLRLAPVDFGGPAVASPLAPAAAPGPRTVLVAEGLLMYLVEADVRRLLRLAHALGAAGSRLVFTFVGTRPDGRPEAGPTAPLLNLLLRSIGEPFRFGISPDRLGPFLAEEGWTLDRVTREEEIAARSLTDVPARLLDWELVGEATRGRPGRA